MAFTDALTHELSLCAAKEKRQTCFASAGAKKEKHHFRGAFYGAGDEARTRYLHLGKVALYRMSYTREQVVL